MGAFSTIPLPLSGANGGTGTVNPGGQLSLTGNLQIVGSSTYFLTFTGSSSVTFPTSGILANQDYVNSAITGLLHLQGAQDCSTNPNYPSANKVDAYVVSVAGKIGGASGTAVDAGDVYFATANNAGGTEASVGTSWAHIEHNLPALGTMATQAASAVAITGGTLSGTVAYTGAPITDTYLAGLVKPAVALVAAANVTLSGEQTIDGVLSSASLILATGQTSGAENGPWLSAAGAWTRPGWYTNGSAVQAPQFLTTFVRLGTTYQGSTWRMTTASVTIGTTVTAWVQTPTNINSVTGTLSGSSVSGGTFGAVNASALTALTAASITASTTVGRNLLNLTNPSAVTWNRVNADNSVSSRTAAQTLSDIGAQASGSYAASGANSDITSLSGTAAITGGAGSMTITSGTGNSRTLALRTTTSGGTATTAITLGADQSVTLAANLVLGGTGAGITGIGSGIAAVVGGNWDINNTGASGVTRIYGTSGVVIRSSTSTGTAIMSIRHGISGAMTAGAVTVTDTGATANTRYGGTPHTLGTVAVPAMAYASSRSAGASFVWTSSAPTDTSTWDWWAFEP